MSNGDITTFQLAPLGAVEYAECLAGGGNLYDCSPVGEFINLLTSFFAGKPKLADTIEAQRRLAQSHLWQFQALAANLEIWVRNGVPLSTGNPNYRAQLTGWIAGTLRNSGLGLTEAQIGQADTTLWQVFNSHIELPVKALDNLVTGFQRVNATRPPIPPTRPPPPPPPPPPPGGGGGAGAGARPPRPPAAPPPPPPPRGAGGGRCPPRRARGARGTPPSPRAPPPALSPPPRSRRRADAPRAPPPTRPGRARR